MNWKSNRSPRDWAADSMEDMSWRTCWRARSSSASSVHSAKIATPLCHSVSRYGRVGVKGVIVVGPTYRTDSRDEYSRNSLLAPVLS